jgi:hypothetical protein
MSASVSAESVKMYLGDHEELRILVEVWTLYVLYRTRDTITFGLAAILCFRCRLSSQHHGILLSLRRILLSLICERCQVHVILLYVEISAPKSNTRWLILARPHVPKTSVKKHEYHMSIRGLTKMVDVSFPRLCIHPYRT